MLRGSLPEVLRPRCIVLLNGTIEVFDFLEVPMEPHWYHLVFCCDKSVQGDSNFDTHLCTSEYWYWWVGREGIDLLKPEVAWYVF